MCNDVALRVKRGANRAGTGDGAWPARAPADDPAGPTRSPSTMTSQVLSEFRVVVQFE